MRETFSPVDPRRTYSIAGPALFHAEQLDVEHERRVRRNGAAGAAGAVAKIGRDDQRALPADFHPRDPHVPPADHLARAELERERLAAVARAVELLPVLVGGLRVVQPAGVMDRHFFARRSRGAGPGLRVTHLQA